jgi:DNA polymerase sigma
VNFIKPTEQDIAKRQDAVKFVETILNSVEGCEDCKTVVFGSFANDLMLPSSDVDLMIRTKNNSNDKNLVLKLADALKLDLPNRSKLFPELECQSLSFPTDVSILMSVSTIILLREELSS